MIIVAKIKKKQKLANTLLSYTYLNSLDNKSMFSQIFLIELINKNCFITNINNLLIFMIYIIYFLYPSKIMNKTYM